MKFRVPVLAITKKDVPNLLCNHTDAGGGLIGCMHNQCTFKLEVR